jgi:hypothetical protein
MLGRDVAVGDGGVVGRHGVVEAILEGGPRDIEHCRSV